MTTHEDNSICIDQIDKDLVHDEIHDFSVPAENGGANGSANAYIFSCSSPVNVSAHNGNATTLKEIPFFKKLDKFYE